MRLTIMTILGLTVLSAANADPAPARHYYTDAKISTMRSNIAKYDWARKKRDEILVTADKWAAYDDERLRTLVIPPQVPRCYDLHNQGCPIHGVKAYETGLYTWKIDFDKPFKVVCPFGGEEYPSNDFAAYLASGMKDRSLLTGEYADDGWGWHKPGDNTPANYWFVAFYTHWSMQRWLREAITSLSEAALVTDDPAAARKYAHKCAVLLWQLAEWYPDYDYAKQSREGKEHNPEYHGKLTNHIWEVGTPTCCAPAYDAVRPFLAGDTDLQKLAGKSAAEIDEGIRERLLREAVRCVVEANGRIAGNYGMHQRALLTLALVLDEKKTSPTSEEMIRFVVENPAPKVPQDMGLRDALVNMVYRDGLPMESLGYNRIWIDQIVDIADALAGCGIDFFQDSRMQKLLNWPFDVCMGGRYFPSVGDTGDMFQMGALWKRPELYAQVLRHLKDPRFAWAAAQGNASSDDLFSAENAAAGAEAGKPLSVGAKPRLFPAYGLANLQFGMGLDAAASCLYLSSHPYHRHADQLNLLLFGHGNALLTDIGYPEQTDAFNYRRGGYFDNTISHNTVTVDAIQQRRGPCTLHAFSTRGFAQFADASAEGPYPGITSLYRRANMLVQVGPGQSYLFDVFYVRGGKQHDFTLHGTQADLVSEPALGPVQEKGTLAGTDVPYEQFYDDPELKDKPLGSVSYSGYKGSGFQFLTNVQRAPLRNGFVGEWKLTEPIKGQPERPWKGIGLRAHFLGRDEEVISCDGPVQHYDSMPKWVKCLIRRRTDPSASPLGKGGQLESRFVSVFESYKDRTWIKRVWPVKIEPDDGQACAAMVELVDGARHYLFHSLTPEKTYVLDGKVTVAGQAACLVTDANGKAMRAMLMNGTVLQVGGQAMKGHGVQKTTIASVDYERGVVEIADPVLTRDLRPGTVMLVRGKGFSDSVTLQKVIDKTHFSIGDEDLRVAGGPVKEVKGKELVTPVQTPNAAVGMTLLNSRLQPIGRLVKGTKEAWVIDRALSESDLPKADGDSNARFYIVMAGPGDEIWIPDYVEKDWSK